MHAAHGAAIAIQEILPVGRQLRQLLIQLVERNLQNFVVSQFQR